MSQQVHHHGDEEENDDFAGYDENFVETAKFRYVFPHQGSCPLLQDPMVTTSVINLPVCAFAEIAKAAGYWPEAEYKGVCCMFCKTGCCFPWNLLCCKKDLYPYKLTEVSNFKNKKITVTFIKYYQIVFCLSFI